METMEYTSKENAAWRKAEEVLYAYLRERFSKSGKSGLGHFGLVFSETEHATNIALFAGAEQIEVTKFDMAELKALKSNVLPEVEAFVFVYDFRSGERFMRGSAPCAFAPEVYESAVNTLYARMWNTPDILGRKINNGCNPVSDNIHQRDVTLYEVNEAGSGDSLLKEQESLKWVIGEHEDMFNRATRMLGLVSAGDSDQVYECRVGKHYLDASRTERNQHLVREFLKKKEGYNLGENDYFVTVFDPVNVTSVVAVVENPRNAGTPESMAKVVNELLKNQTLGEKFAIRKAAGLF